MGGRRVAHIPEEAAVAKEKALRKGGNRCFLFTFDDLGYLLIGWGENPHWDLRARELRDNSRWRWVSRCTGQSRDWIQGSNRIICTSMRLM